MPSAETEWEETFDRPSSVSGMFCLSSCNSQGPLCLVSDEGAFTVWINPCKDLLNGTHPFKVRSRFPGSHNPPFRGKEVQNEGNFKCKVKLQVISRTHIVWRDKSWEVFTKSLWPSYVGLQKRLKNGLILQQSSGLTCMFLHSERGESKHLWGEYSNFMQKTHRPGFNPQPNTVV